MKNENQTDSELERLMHSIKTCDKIIDILKHGEFNDREDMIKCVLMMLSRLMKKFKYSNCVCKICLGRFYQVWRDTEKLIRKEFQDHLDKI